MVFSYDFLLYFKRETIFNIVAKTSKIIVYFYGFTMDKVNTWRRTKKKIVRFMRHEQDAPNIQTWWCQVVKWAQKTGKTDAYNIT